MTTAPTTTPNGSPHVNSLTPEVQARIALTADLRAHEAGLPRATRPEQTTHLDQLEARSIHILREAYREFKNLCLLWSIGKDSTVLLWLARKAFYGHVPFPLVHIDTAFEMPDMTAWRDKLAREWHLDMVYGMNTEAIAAKNTFPDGKLTRIGCCRVLKTEALKHTLSGDWTRMRFNHTKQAYEADPDRTPYTGVIIGARADEEGSRSKERYFSPRDQYSEWNIDDQPPELWNYYKTDFAPGTHLRIHPLLDWTELNVWEYIEREQIPMIPLYFNQGDGTRNRSLGCWPCTFTIQSPATNVAEVIEELRSGKLKNIAERSGRAQDQEDGNSLETLRREGYM